MGLLHNEETTTTGGAGGDDTVLQFSTVKLATTVSSTTPIAEFDSEPISQSATPNSSIQSASPPNGLLTLPTILQGAAFVEKQQMLLEQQKQLLLQHQQLHQLHQQHQQQQQQQLQHQLHRRPTISSTSSTSSTVSSSIHNDGDGGATVTTTTGGGADPAGASVIFDPTSGLDAARSISLLDPFAQSKLFLPVFPKPSFYNLGVNGLRWLSENPLRQRGLRFRPEEDPQSFVTCQLCGNSILGNREINLQNHARRHSTLKQFQCCYCHYVHSEITKVRLHMSHNHNDNYSRPINNVNTEMRESWRALMNDCFPGHPFVAEQLQRRYTQQATQAAIQYQRIRTGIDYAQQFRYCPF